LTKIQFAKKTGQKVNFSKNKKSGVQNVRLGELNNFVTGVSITFICKTLTKSIKTVESDQIW
jgi:hypothetical protein